MAGWAPRPCVNPALTGPREGDPLQSASIAISLNKQGRPALPTSPVLTALTAVDGFQFHLTFGVSLLT